jgi:hypothetical protein
LEDYSAKDTEEEKRIIGTFASGIDALRMRYRKRFPRLQEPIAWTHGLMSVWPQIPLYGTLIIPLHPLREKLSRKKGGKEERFEPFRGHHGFEPADVQQLVDFARNTGRVAFVLVKDATEYEGLDFLDPIFSELRPPRRMSILSELGKTLSTSELARLKYARIEFDTLGRIRLLSFLRSLLDYRLESLPFDVSATYADGAYTYSILDFFGYSGLTALIREAMTDYPPRVLGLLHLYTELILLPRFDLLGGIHNINLTGFVYPDAIQLLQTDKPDESKGRPYSYEIGKFLMNKLVPYPVGFEACRTMCDTYKHYDLQQVMLALQRAARAEDYSGIRSGSKQLAETLDNIWSDTNKIASKANIIRAGVPLSIALLGEVAAGPIGAITGGFLAKLGYDVLEKFMEIKTEALSEKIAKYSAPNYLVSVFDFKKKYDLK